MFFSWYQERSAKDVLFLLGSALVYQSMVTLVSRMICVSLLRSSLTLYPKYKYELSSRIPVNYLNRLTVARYSCRISRTKEISLPFSTIAIPDISIQAYSIKDDGSTEPEEDESSDTEEERFAIAAIGGYRDCTWFAACHD